ncbi:SIMPL domain-containing protein [Undibacterium cyanobacteriorum]|uniref:SIMPL domain-containing protein n=1 Tax=Undibacterium cyanobacteriorum TaxID=3073561 RepID=A0ABY9RGL1_9BURK|nr:SIMPL domain-containing protein [Undibacterium sp. 20NA77.5]WMW79420.1 SIMPL domain-containing protein [Undibacterium sp. 20NA77.5]
MRFVIFLVALLATTNWAFAQELGKDSRLLMAGTANLKIANDRAVILFSVTEEGKDKELVISNVNKKAKDVLERLKANYREVEVSTPTYYVESIYEEQETQISQSRKSVKSQRIGWKASQNIELRTTALHVLPKLIADFQKTVELESLRFELSEATKKRAEKDRLEAAYRNLFERMEMVAQIMGKKPSDFQLDSVDFDGIESGSGRYQTVQASGSSLGRSGSRNVEPNFEPGVSTVQARVEARIRIK